MIDVKDKVHKALNGIKGVQAFFYYPDSFSKLPCVSYYEAHNSPDMAADDEEYLSEIVYVVDVWDQTSEKVTRIALKANAAMKKIGFSREFSHDVHNPDRNVRQKTMRFVLKT